MSMTESQAKSEALRLAGEGKTHASIAEHLNAKGYRTVRGLPMIDKYVSAMLIKAGHRTQKKKKARRAPAPKTVAAAEKATRRTSVPKTAVDRLTAVKAVLNCSVMPEGERIAFALLLIG